MPFQYKAVKPYNNITQKTDRDHTLTKTFLTKVSMKKLFLHLKNTSRT
jgi:hypothetical protein